MQIELLKFGPILVKFFSGALSLSLSLSCMFGIVYCAHHSVPRGQSGVYPVNKGDPSEDPSNPLEGACVQK